MYQELKDRAFENFRHKLEKLHSLAEEEWMELYKQLDLKVYKKGDFLIQPGQSSAQFFYIHKGLVKRFCHSHDGKPYIMSFDGEKRLVSEFSSLIRELPTRCYIQTLEETYVLASKIGAHTYLRKRDIGWVHIGRIIAESRYIEKSEREYDLLLYNSKDRLKRFNKKNPGLIDRIQQKDIAAYIGVTPESLNRLMKTM